MGTLQSGAQSHELISHDCTMRKLGPDRYFLHVNVVVRQEHESIKHIVFKREGRCRDCLRRIAERKLSRQLGCKVQLHVREVA